MKEPNSRDVIIAALNGSRIDGFMEASDEQLADNIIRALAAQHLHVFKSKGLSA